MNCAQVRARLPLFDYADLPPAETNSVREHLANCAACRAELTDFRNLRAALDAVPAPAVNVDLPRLFQTAAARQARRWRRVDATVCAVAAALLLVVLLRLEIRVEARQLTLRWGGAPVEDKARVSPPVERITVREDQAALTDLQERVRVLDDLLHAVIPDIADRDDRQTKRLARLQDRIEEVRIQNGRRWSDTERNVAAMYTALFILPKKGANP